MALDHRRIPYAIAQGNRLFLADEALSYTGFLQCPCCMDRVVLTSVSGGLGFAHMRRNRRCQLTGKGKEWRTYAARYDLNVKLSRMASPPVRGRRMSLYRRCYNCRTLREDVLPSGSAKVVIDHEPLGGRSSGKPDVAVLDRAMNPKAFFFLTSGEKVAVGEETRKVPSFIVDAESLLEDQYSVVVLHTYGLPSPACPCQGADRIRIEAESGVAMVPCPKAAAPSPARVDLGACRRCPHHLSFFRESIQCGFRIGIRKQPPHPKERAER